MANRIVLCGWLGRSGCVFAACERGADIEMRDKSGKSVLIWAIRAGACRVASELIRLGADVNYRTPDGRTAMNSCENLTIDYVRPKLLAAEAKE